MNQQTMKRAAVIVIAGAVALGAAISELRSFGWDAIVAHEQELAERLRSGLAATRGVRLLGPALDVPTLAVAAFEIDDVPHALVAARLSAEFGIGVRHGCFCAHPYLMRLLDLPRDVVDQYREDVRRGDRRRDGIRPLHQRGDAGSNTPDEPTAVDACVPGARLGRSGRDAWRRAALGRKCRRCQP